MAPGFYPRESYQADETGLAAVYPAGHDTLTTDAEAFDQSNFALLGVEA